jgi:plastocyanin
MGLLRRLALLGAVACAAYAAPAAAATKIVKLGNSNKIAPQAVSISPGDTVTWDWVGPDTDHSPEAYPGQGEYWDADPGEDGEYDHKLGPNFSHKFTYSGTFRYRCTVHPDLMQGTVTVKGPSAALAVTTKTPVTGSPVTFDAGATKDTAGKVVGYRWDLDGDPATGPDGFETDTGRTPTASATYASTGSRAVRVQAVDAKGYRGMAIVRVAIESPVPDPSFMTSPYTPARGDVVSFDARSTTDADGDVATYEWDLDGDPTTGPDGFETNSGASPTASFVYTRGGSFDVRLRVTDAAGHSAIASRRVTIPNSPPTATFAAGPAVAGTPLTLDASGSADPDGAIARYLWDLDGDGTFETDTGATPRVTHTFTAPGTVTVRLRVVDPAGAAAEVAHPITIAARAADPRLVATALRTQRASRTGRVVVAASCSRACTVAARATVKMPGSRRVLALRAVRRPLRAGRRSTLELALPRAARRALRAGRRLAATVTVTAPGGQRRTLRITLR